MVFFFNDTATTEIYTLSLHDALPISADTPYSAIAKPNSDATTAPSETQGYQPPAEPPEPAKASNASSFSFPESRIEDVDRKSTRLNSSHANISYAVFCLKKKNYIHLY